MLGPIIIGKTGREKNLVKNGLPKNGNQVAIAFINIFNG